MAEFFTRKEFAAAADFIRSRTDHEPTIGLILGTGLNPFAEAMLAWPQKADVIPYGEIPHFPVSTIEGHVGRLVIGELEGQEILVMQGRAHHYEGYSPQHTVLPIRAMQLLGIGTLIVTNAAGGLNPAFQAGDLMLITDHINLVGMAGLNPLRGPNDPELGPRFVDMSQAYDLKLREMALRVADGLGFTLHQGVYICLAGPTFETPADLKFLRLIGVDAVGMSTVPEVTVARHAGMRALGISGISNMAVVEPTGESKAVHEEVLEAGTILVPKLTALLKGVISRLASEGGSLDK